MGKTPKTYAKEDGRILIEGQPYKLKSRNACMDFTVQAGTIVQITNIDKYSGSCSIKTIPKEGAGSTMTGISLEDFI
jgi:hypothetical protein